MEMINYEGKEMMPLNDEENKSYEKQEVCRMSHMQKKVL